MLMLSRKVGTGVTITISPGVALQLAQVGEPLIIHVGVNKIEGSKAQLGFEAPREVEIVRDEILERGRESA